jgi:mannose-6-phosphate isomerase-like protein (cupin superfamily)
MNLAEPDKLRALEAAVRQLPQIEFQTNHYFADGMYGRELVQPAGTVVVGKVHKREHFFIVTKGSLQIACDGETMTVRAPCVIVSSPGTQRALFAMEDSVYMTVHRTNKKNLDKIERELIEPAPNALLDSRNKLKVKELP